MIDDSLSSGSGGNNHAVEYYEETKYPLAVKLGTISPDGAGQLETCDKHLHFHMHVQIH